MQTKPKLLIFDVNETLLNMEPVKEAVTKALKSPIAFRQWFSWLLHYSLVDTVTSAYHNFGELAEACLFMTASSLETTVSKNEVQHITQQMQQLKPYAEVNEALNCLKDKGYRMVTLTNSSTEALQKQLAYADIAHFFEANYSIDGLKLYKPHPETYLKTITTCKVSANEAMLIAAHGWDTAGAARAGLQAAFVARTGQAVYPLATLPQITGKDLLEVATQLTAIK